MDIDLGGFELTGSPGSGDGIVLLPGFTSVTVHDGQVGGWGGNGINLAGGDRNRVYNVTVESNGLVGANIGMQSIGHDIVADSNGTTGIVTGPFCKLSDCTSHDNAFAGVFAGPSTHVSNSTTFANMGNGFTLLPSCVIIGCTAESNGGDGYSMDTNCRASNCTALRNGFVISGNGFNLIGGAASVEGCTAQQNFESGFNAFGFGSSATDCVASMNGLPSGFGSGVFGFQTVIGCTASGNFVDGISVAFGTVRSCTANSNGDDGIEGFNAVVESCQTSTNGDSGIEAAESQVQLNTSNGNFASGIGVVFNCHVWRNKSNGNGVGGFGSGITAFGAGNNIEENHCVANFFGAAVDTITFAAGMSNAVLSNRETGNPLGYMIDFGANTYGAFYLGPTGAPIETFPFFGGENHFVNISY